MLSGINGIHEPENLFNL